MRKYLFVLAMALGAAAMADERAMDPQAIAQLSRLADAGNPNAQLRLGHAYWYGRGVPVDRDKADALFAKAAAAGNQEAASAQRLTAARQQHGAAIEHWTSKYDGADLTSGPFQCTPPVLPTLSKNNRDIKARETAVANWKQCYNGFAMNLNDAMPPGKRIPAEIAVLMTEAEMAQAKAHLERVYQRVADGGRAGAEQTLAAYDKWAKSTAAYVSHTNTDAEQRNEETELLREHAIRSVAPPRR